MKNLTMIGTILLTSSLSLAIVPHNMPKPPSQVPTVECSYSVNERTENGSTKDFKDGETLKLKITEEKTTSVMGFKLKAYLKQFCIQTGSVNGIGGAKCTDTYTIMPTLTYDGGISSTTQLAVKKADKNKSLVLTLNVGNRDATAICTVK